MDVPRPVCLLGQGCGCEQRCSANSLPATRWTPLRFAVASLPKFSPAGFVFRARGRSPFDAGYSHRPLGPEWSFSLAQEV